MIIHIGKCGGSNITTKFKSIHNIDLPVIHCCSASPKSMELTDHITILIRNPMSRFVSIFYYYYNYYLRALSGQPIAHQSTINHLTPVFNEYQTVEEFVRDIPTNSPLIQKAFKEMRHLRFNMSYHINPVLPYIQHNKTIFIIRQEYYADDFTNYYNYLISKYKLPNHLTDFLTTKHNNTDQYNSRKYLSPESQKILITKLKGEYDALFQLKEAGHITNEYYESMFLYK